MYIHLYYFLNARSNTIPQAYGSKEDSSVAAACSNKPKALTSFVGINSVPFPLYFDSKYRQIARDSTDKQKKTFFQSN